MVWKRKRGGLISRCLTLSSLPSLLCPFPPSFFSPLDSGMEETIYLHSLLSHSSILSFSFCTLLPLPPPLPPTSIDWLLYFYRTPHTVLSTPSHIALLLTNPSSSFLPSLFNFTRSSVSQCLFSYPFHSLFLLCSSVLSYPFPFFFIILRSSEYCALFPYPFLFPSSIPSFQHIAILDVIHHWTIRLFPSLFTFLFSVPSFLLLASS